MPRAEGLKHFPKGIRVVKQWTGKESKEMLRQMLPAVLSDLHPKKAQSLIDFIFQAHAASMTKAELGHLEHNLDMFHKSKEVLLAKGYYKSSKCFDHIAKIHALSHYVDVI